MGEIGIPRREFLYRLKMWEIRAIIRGYRRKQETQWAMCRWQTFWLLHNGMNDLSKAGIRTPQDLLELPHDRKDDDTDHDPLPTDEEIAKMQEEMRRWNEERANK